MSSRAVIASLCLCLAGCACDGRAFSIDASSRALVGCARVASSAAERTRGLVGHAPLAPGEALWLEWPTSVEACIHNSGVTFSIDVVFVDASATVIAIERAVAADDSTPRCHSGVRHVIEITSGAADTVSIGARVRW